MVRTNIIMAYHADMVAGPNLDEHILKHLKKDHQVSEGMTLADIYNIDTEVYKTSTKGNKIGF